VATVFLIRGDPTPWRTQAPWWTSMPRSLILGVPALRRQTKREGIQLIDLFGRTAPDSDAKRCGFLYLSQYFLSSREARSLRVGCVRNDATRSAMLAPGLLSDRQLPLWRSVYSPVGCLGSFGLHRRSHIPRILCSSSPGPAGSTWATVTLSVSGGHFSTACPRWWFDRRLIVFRFLQFLPWS